MICSEPFQDLDVEIEDHVACVEIQRPPNNYMDEVLIKSLADSFNLLEKTEACRCIVLASSGKHFCAGAKFLDSSGAHRDVDTSAIYENAKRIFKTKKPIVAAIQGAAIGGGLGLALAADFRVTCESAKFSANFTRLGIHPGFGISVTLPRTIGQQQASLLLLTGRRICGTDAHRMGLAEVLVDQAEVRSAAMSLAIEIANCAPLAIRATRKTLRADLVHDIDATIEQEFTEQFSLQQTQDYHEGLAAMKERRVPEFRGR